ncbi:PqiB family protein [Desulforhopalus sp. IMCC35007]|uniref:PqiB family protein n=1 Tax=Desulforhopalus sp. IMCC35007 TaxID=2569543 RepID=UPI0010ADF71E|nr:MlaD family protein [Desulforhopalus sp. IMCC35007]TKB11580.1 MCE family protein [Desulforhopalus sp. IMCC35007]
MKPEPVVNKNRGISAIWILPIVALCICISILYSSYKNAGEDITIFFADATGLTPGKTQVVTKGIPIGLVKKITPDLANHQIKATVKIDKEAVDYLVDDTLFWIVRPELSASSITGLDTILSGSYIGVQVGSSKKSQNTFKGLSSPPPVSSEAPGLHLQLRAETLGSIQAGTGIYYRNIEIGTVQNYTLERDQNILIDFFIEPKFAHLVREGSRFCNASGIQLSGKLPNIKLRVESLASLLKGGILLHTPDQLQDSPQVINGHIFSLYKDYESANYGIPMTLTLASGKDIVEGATKIMYRGLEAGFVQEISIDNDEQKTVTAHILLDPRTEMILKEGTKFWMEKPEITPTGIQNLQLLLAGAYITFQPGPGKFKNHFNILTEPPSAPPLRPGKSFLLTSEGPSEINKNSPVYFKNIPVGIVVDVNLATSGKEIRTHIYVYEEYLHLLSKKSIFWIHSGIELSTSIEDGISLSTGPLTRMLIGGISFTTPDKLAKKKNFSPEENHIFQLHDSYESAIADVPELQHSGKTVSILAEDASSLSIGAPILHKNIKIGIIEDFSLTGDQQSVLVKCLIYDEYKNLVNNQTRFYNTSGLQLSGGLSGVRFQTGSLQSIIAGGIGCFNTPKKSNRKQPGEPYPLYSDLQEALHADEIDLTVTFQDTKGLKEGSSVRYKGIEVGKVQHLSFSGDLKTIVAKVSVHESLSELFRKNTMFWVAEAEINLNGVKNVDTIVFGSFLSFLPGDGAPRRSFVALPEPPRNKIANINGLGIVLESKHLGSLSPGSPVYYRQVLIGQVTDYELSPTFQKVYIFVSIKDRYRAIIRSNTRFWNVSGATIEGGLFSGVKVSTESLEAIMKGGIALATPDDEKVGAAASAGAHFRLYDKPEKKWLDWNPDVVLLELEESNKILLQKNNDK